MKTLNFDFLPQKAGFKTVEVVLLPVLLLALWPLTQWYIRYRDQTAGYIDPNIFLLILLGFISFWLTLSLCWWLLQRFWMALGLPGLSSMVLQFKTLELWQQLGFYWLSFALLLLAGVMCLMAIC